MLKAITWGQFIGLYILAYLILVLVVFGKQLPLLLKGRPEVKPDKKAKRIWTPGPSSGSEDSPHEPANTKSAAMSQLEPLSENEMYDSASLLMDELDDLFNAGFNEDWDQDQLVQHLHRKLQSYSGLQQTKMYGSVNAYIQHQSYAICAVEFTAQEVANLW